MGSVLGLFFRSSIGIRLLPWWCIDCDGLVLHYAIPNVGGDAISHLGASMMSKVCSDVCDICKCQRAIFFSIDGRSSPVYVRTLGASYVGHFCSCLISSTMSIIPDSKPFIYLKVVCPPGVIRTRDAYVYLFRLLVLSGGIHFPDCRNDIICGVRDRFPFRIACCSSGRCAFYIHLFHPITSARVVLRFYGVW